EQTARVSADPDMALEITKKTTHVSRRSVYRLDAPDAPCGVSEVEAGFRADPEAAAPVFQEGADIRRLARQMVEGNLLSGGIRVLLQAVKAGRGSNPEDAFAILGQREDVEGGRLIRDPDHLDVALRRAPRLRRIPMSEAADGTCPVGPVVRLEQRVDR